MGFIAAYHTDVGIKKKTNQDSLAIKIVDTKEGIVAFGIMCDGMGGLSKGELASKEVIMAFSDWFDDVLIQDVVDGNFDENRLVSQWDDIVQTQNKRLGEYGAAHNLMLGTTLSAVLIYRNQYFIVHVGDSRIYCLTDRVRMLTNDQTFVAREIAAGRMTKEQAKVDPRRSVLLQCVGASPVVEPEFIKGNVTSGAVYMLCSDGFRHQISEAEILEKLGPAAAIDEETMKYGCIYLTELVKNRQENDNISVALIKEV